MHPKKSEAQIGKDSVGVSSDFNPVHHHSHALPSLHHHPPPPSAAGTALEHGNFLQIQIQSPNCVPSLGHGTHSVPSTPCHPHLLSAPHKRPVMNSTLSHSQTLQSLHALHSPPQSTSPPPHPPPPAAPRQWYHHYLRLLPYAAASTTRTALRYLRRLHFRLRLLILLSFPSLYLFLGRGGGEGGRSLLFDFLSALAFSSAVLLLLFVSFTVLPFPSLRLFLSRSSSFLLPDHHPRQSRRRSPPPVLWSIGSGPKPKTEKHPTSGSWVQVYSNGDVYEGEFHLGKCSGSGVYYYYMSGRYEGDWVDGKYDGYGVETWARGSRYRGQYRQGLRHGYGIYGFYTGDVYAGEWSNGQSHGCGVHTCEDGSRYVGEFKWGVKHGLGHYHFSSIW